MATKPRTELSIYMNKPEVVSRYQEIFPNEQAAKSYIQSVLILVASDDKLIECTPRSIFVSSLRAASLGLSCDKSLKQAWLVPYRRNIGTRDEPQWINEAQFQPHYLGLYNLAMRTGRYKVIRVAPVYEGTRVLENTLTGLHYIEEDGLISMPANPNAVYRDVTARRRKDLKVIGWLSYFMTMKGAEKSEYMSVVEIEDHAERFVKGYKDEKTGKIKNENWRDPEKRAVMEMKTVFKKLTNWMDLSGTESANLVKAIQADEPDLVDVPAENIPEIPEVVTGQMTYEQAQTMRAETPWGNLTIGSLDRDKINDIYWHENITEEQREAMKIVLQAEYSVEPPEQPKRTPAQSLKELGY